MGGAEFAGGGELRLVDIDGDDGARPADARALDGGQPDAARAEHGDGGAGLDGGGVEHGAEARRHAAADQRGAVEFDVVADPHERVAVDEHLLGVGGEAGELLDAAAAPGQRGLVAGAAHGPPRAQERLAAEAAFAGSAEHGEAGDDAVAGRELRDLRSHRLDVAGGLVAQHGGGGHDVVAVVEVDVGVADAAGGGADDHLLRARFAAVDVLDRERLVGGVEYGGLHGAPPSAPRAGGAAARAWCAMRPRAVYGRRGRLGAGGEAALRRPAAAGRRTGPAGGCRARRAPARPRA